MSELPAGWDVIPLGTLLRAIEAGQNVKCEERPPTAGEAGLVKISAVTWGRFNEEASKTLPKDTLLNERNRIRSGDLLISRANTIELVGASVIVGSVEKRLYLSDKVLRLVVDEPVKRWINYALKTPQLRQAIQAASTGNQLSMRNIPQEKLRSLSIPLAPAAEQTRIADQLDTLLARIQACNDRLDAIPALLKRFRKAVLDAATTGALTDQWRIQRNEPQWETSLIGECGAVTGGLTKNSKRNEAALRKPYLRVANVQSAFLDLSDVAQIGLTASEYEKTRLQIGDLLIVEGNGSIDQVGRVAIWNGELDECVHQNHLIRWRGRGPLPKWVLIWLLSTTGRSALMERASTTTGLYTLSISKVSSVPIRLPSLHEQAEIVSRVDALFKLAKRIEARHAFATAQADRLTPLTLAKAFRGELVQQDANDELASVLLQSLAKTPRTVVKAPRGRPGTKRLDKSTTLPTTHADWASLPTGAWAAGARPDEHATTAQLIAVLKAWGEPMPQDLARLAAVLCLQPRLFTAALPAQDAASWRRLVGAEAEPLPASVAALQPAVNTHWRRALAGLRARGDLVVAGASPQDSWALGSGADHVDTTGWPDGRAGWVVAYLRAHGIEALLPQLSPAAVDFVHARAA